MIFLPLEGEGIPHSGYIHRRNISACACRNIRGVFDPWKLRSDEKIIKYLCSIGLPYSSFDIVAMGFIIKVFRYDTKAFYEYFHVFAAAKRPKLRTPIHFIVGEKDKVTKNYTRKYREWLAYSNKVSLHVIADAEHYFINSHSHELAGIIKEQLQESSLSC